MTILKTCADYESSMTENVKTHSARTGRETQETGLGGTSLIRRQVSELHRLRCRIQQDTKCLTPAAPPTKSPHDLSSNEEKKTQTSPRSFAIAHASPYHSQHHPAWEMSACHCLARLCCACALCVCWLCMWASWGHWDIWVWDGLEQWCGGSRIARVERTATVQHLPLPILVKAIQSIILLLYSSPPRLSHSECDGWTPLAFISMPRTKQSWMQTRMFRYTWSN